MGGWWIAAGLIVLAIVAFEWLAPARAAALALGLERRRNGLSARQVTVGDVDLHYLEGGRGETLVLLHGFGADKDNYTRIAGHLTPHFHVISPDLPGFGQSTRLHDAPYSFLDQTRRLHDLLHGMGLKRFHIAGSSMGGAMAALYGALYPDEVITRWLLAPAGVEGCDDSEMAAHFRATEVSLLLPTSVADFERVMNLAVSKRPFLTPSIKKVMGRRAMADSTLHTRIFREIALAPAINQQMRTSQVPTLIVWGDEDRVLDPSGAPILNDVLPNSELIVMPGIGHLPMVESPKQVALDYIDFVKRHAS